MTNQWKIFYWISSIMVFFSFALACAQQEENVLVVNSGEASYDGNEIILSGDVNVKHSLGVISACQFSMQTLREKGKFPFSLLKIDENVEIKLSGGGELFCQHALVDYSQMKGFFYGDETHPDSELW